MSVIVGQAVINSRRLHLHDAPIRAFVSFHFLSSCFVYNRFSSLNIFCCGLSHIRIIRATLYIMNIMCFSFLLYYILIFAEHSYNIVKQCSLYLVNKALIISCIMYRYYFMVRAHTPCHIILARSAVKNILFWVVRAKVMVL